MSFVRILTGRPIYAASAAVFGFAVAVAAISIVATPYDPFALSLPHQLAGPSPAHPFGFDNFGRDVLSRVMVGLRTSLFISAASVAIALAIGTGLGVAAGYFRGIADRVISALVNAFLVLPGILLALALIALFGGTMSSLILALGLAYAPGVARVVRGVALSLRERAFVEAARVMGKRDGAIILRHILPNIVAPVSVLASSLFAQAFLSESALSFLGLGIAPPHPSLGGILAEGHRFLDAAAWLALIPGAIIAAVLLSINILGDALRDWLDPRPVRDLL